MHATLLRALGFLSLVAAAVPPRAYPPPDAHLRPTSILNHTHYVAGLDDPQWYIDNIPFIDVPDQSLQDVYYYRASVTKRHLKYTHQGHGWVFTEFIQPVSWASKFQTIPDSAGHQILESRWLRDPRYAKDVISHYTRGGAETLIGTTYTHFLHRAIFEHAQSTGDVSFLTAQLDGMILMYGLWDAQRDTATGLYHRTPLLDAQEYSLPNYLVGGPHGSAVSRWNDPANNFSLIDNGPETFRVSFNAFMVAAAAAIADTATLAGNQSVADTWARRATDQQDRMYRYLYDTETDFFVDAIPQPAPGQHESLLNVTGRQLIGFYPYRFHLGTPPAAVKGLEAGLDTQGFLSSYGPTTLERRNEYFTERKNITYCCLWQGQSWPFSTSVYLTTLALIARQNASSLITPDLFQSALSTYVRTNYKDGTPYTAEAHYPTLDAWSADTTNHSEHYLHSTFHDNVFTNLIGVVPTFDDRLELKPLVPGNWTYWAVENLPYHGTLLTIIWDATGTHYNQGQGLTIWSNNTQIHTQPTLTPVNVTLPFNSTTAAATLAAAPRWENIAANPNTPWGLPSVQADWLFTSNGDLSSTQAYKMNDGLSWFDITPDNFWTSNQTSVPFTVLNITLPRARNISSVTLGILSNIPDTHSRQAAPLGGGVISCPESIIITLRDGRTVADRSPWTSCTGNAFNTIALDPPAPDPMNRTTPGTGATVETDFLQLTILDGLGTSTAITELQVWVPSTPGPRYEVEDGLTGLFVGGFEGTQAGLNSTVHEGGVELGENGWVELADVRRGQGVGEAGETTLTVTGSGGTVEVQMNYLANTTVTFTGNETQRKEASVRFLEGGNVVTLIQTDGKPFLDAIEVS